MSSIVVAGDTSGSVTLSAPAVAGSTVLTLPSVSGTILQTGTTVTEAQGGTGTTTGYYGFKNRIINGAMGIWQRGTSFSISAGTVTYTSDRFASFQTNTSPTVSQSTDVPTVQGFKYSIKIQRPVTNTGTAGQYISQAIESVNMLDLAGQSISLSFWAKAGANYSATSNLLNVTINTGTVADQGLTSAFSGTWTGASSIINTTITLTTSWQKFTITGAVGSTALELALLIYQTPTGTAGADDSFYITGVQLEKGSTATSFDYRPYSAEFDMCRRYYEQVVMNIGTAANSTTSVNTSMSWYPKRASPTLGQTGAIGVTLSGVGSFTQSSVSISGTATYNGGQFSLGNFTGLTAEWTYYQNLTNTNNVTVSAEL